MKKFLVIVFIILTAINISNAKDLEQVFDKAGKEYTSGNYYNALQDYLNIIEQGKESPELYYNIGNSYYKLGEYPKAILYYEKALKLDNSNEDAKFNLRIVNLKIIDKITEIEPFFLFKWFDSLRNFFSISGLSVIFIVLFFISAGFFIFVYFIKSNKLKKSLLLVSGIVFAFSIISLSAAGYSKYLNDNSLSGIIMEQTINIKSGLDPTADVSFILHEGTKVKILEEMENWFKIKIADGREGWLPKEALSII